MSPLGVYFLAACAGTLWVAFDARRFDWRGNAFCDQVWKWVVGCVFLFGIAFPAYLWQRRTAPAQSLEAGSWGAGAAAVQRAAEELAVGRTTVWQPELSATAYPAHTSAEKAPLLVSPAPAAMTRTTTEGSLALALISGAGVALAGGLIWAGVVVVTRYDIGFLAWFVGAATGGTAFRVFGAPVRGAARIATGLIAAGAIVVGKYVIFVHEVKKAIGSLLAEQGLSISYLDTRQMSIFVHNFGTIVRPIYALWILIAFTAAVMTAQPRKSRAGQRR
jgi:hypothetical protein